jgi:DNA adenine methylase
MNTLRSPLSWIGGKYYSAPHILRAFPAPSAYDVYVELFGGAAHVLMQKPPYKHIEVYNDLSGDLVNFWMQCRDHARELEQRCRSLPYARSLYYAYHQSLFDGTKMEPLERAARWFYVLRSNFSSEPPPPIANGWSAGTKNKGNSAAHSYHSALDLFSVVQERMRFVLIDQRDFAKVFSSYNRPRVLFYIDPPYLGHELYYRADGNTFSLADHQRLADLLQTTPAYVALSYYPHPVLDELYPESVWHRTTWQTPKHSQRTKSTRERATELLLTNYKPGGRELWEEVSA